MKKTSQEIQLMLEQIGDVDECCFLCGESEYNQCSCCDQPICKNCTIEKDDVRKICEIIRFVVSHGTEISINLSTGTYGATRAA